VSDTDKLLTDAAGSAKRAAAWAVTLNDGARLRREDEENIAGVLTGNVICLESMAREIARLRAAADEECESRLDRARAAYDALREAIEIEQDRALIAESERDAIARLCYRKVETEDLDRETYYRLAILHLCLGPETYDTEPEAVAAVRRLAGLDAAPAVPEPPEDTDPYCKECGNDDRKRLACIDNYANGTRWR
jgi:hypothetical protein